MTKNRTNPAYDLNKPSSSLNLNQKPDTPTSETGLLNRKRLNQQPITVRIDDLPDDKPVPTWGNALLSDRAQLSFEVMGYSSNPVQFIIADEEVVLGRIYPGDANNPDVDLTQYEAQESGVSRRHAMLTKEDGVLKVTDLGSTNGTFLNGIQLQPNRPRIVRLGDQLSLGKLVLKLSGLT